MNTLEKRPDRSERGCSCISAPLFHLSCHCTQLPSHQAPSTKLCGTEHHCQAATSLPHQNILHCLLASPAMQFNVQPPQPRWSGIPEAVNSSRLKIHSIRAHFIHLHPLAVQRHFSPHLLFHHLHLFNLPCSTYLRPCWVVCHQQTLQHTENL